MFFFEAVSVSKGPRKSRNLLFVTTKIQYKTCFPLFQRNEIFDFFSEGSPASLESSHQLIELCIGIFEAFSARSRYSFINGLFYFLFFNYKQCKSKRIAESNQKFKQTLCSIRTSEQVQCCSVVGILLSVQNFKPF